MKINNLDLIIPCYNPQEDWHLYLIKRVIAFQTGLKSSAVKVILVNDGSSDGIDMQHIAAIKEKLPKFEYLDLPINKGKGAALRAGVQKSTAEYCLFTDIDFPYTNESMLQVANTLESEFSVSTGVRSDSYYQQTPAFRKMLSLVFRKVLKIILRLKVDDTQCGLKAFGSIGKKYFLQTKIKRFLFDLEFFKLISKDSLVQIKPVDVELRSGVKFTTMTTAVLIKEMGNFIILLFK